MPELPDITAYLEGFERHAVGQPLDAALIRSPFLLRTVDPPASAAVGRVLEAVSRRGKRIVWHFDGGPHFVFHLMIAGRFRMRPAGAKVPARRGLAGFDFGERRFLLTEEGSKKRASLHVVSTIADVDALDPGGIDVLAASRDDFTAALRARNHTLKRALTDPHILSGIGNAYSDEILHRARLSPVQRTANLADDELTRLHECAVATLEHWIQDLRGAVGDGFPEKVTAFRAGMAAHGRHGEPCPDCGAPIQRIVYASNETNYCAACQTGGRLLADRALSQLLKKDWPKTLEELEVRRRRP